MVAKPGVASLIFFEIFRYFIQVVIFHTATNIRLMIFFIEFGDINVQCLSMVIIKIICYLQDYPRVADSTNIHITVMINWHIEALRICTVLRNKWCKLRNNLQSFKIQYNDTFFIYGVLSCLQNTTH